MIPGHYLSMYINALSPLPFDDRGGEGIEEFGNKIGEIFICPLGYKHSGTGYCNYTGSYVSGCFHGQGEFKCQAGPYYKGQWKMGKKSGKVSVGSYFKLTLI